MVKFMGQDLWLGSWIGYDSNKWDNIHISFRYKFWLMTVGAM